MERPGETGEGLLGALAEGPARLSPDGVAASQRRRMLAAMVAAVAEKGYVRVAVSDVVSRARVSRATFYEHFTHKADCFVAAFHAAADNLVAQLTPQGTEPKAPRERLRTLIGSYLSALAAFPEEARVLLVEIYAAGATAALHRQQIQLDFAGLLRDVHAALAEAGEPVRRLGDFDFEALVGAIGGLATNWAAAGRATDLPELTAPLEAFVLGHFGLEN